MLAGCSALADYIGPPDPYRAQTATASVAQTLTPAAKITPSKFTVAPSPACLEVELPAMQTNSLVLDQVLWSSKNQSLLYIAPGKSSSWYTGDLTIVTAPNWKEPVLLASNVVGSLVWSPDGSKVAFAALRVEESIYTVMIVDLESYKLTDLFPGDAAKENNWSSPKLVLNWSSDGLIDVLVNCGLDCRRILRVSPSGMGSSGGEAQTQDLKEDEGLKISLLPHTHTQEIAESDHPVWSHPNWSPDGKLAVYADLHGITWVFTPARMSQFVLDNIHGTFEETDWSTDGRWLSIRNHGILDIYRLMCQK